MVGNLHLPGSLFLSVFSVYSVVNLSHAIAFTPSSE
jgi:hypothetical protein